MAKPKRDRIREERIHNEAIVAAYGPREQALRNVAVPLSQLTAIDADETTAEAITDWHYWLAQGYCF